MQPVTIDELSQFIRKSARAIMFFLIGDVSRHYVRIGMRYRERSIASAPRKFSRNDVIRIDPVRRTSLQELHHLLDRRSSGKIN